MVLDAALAAHLVRRWASSSSASNLRGVVTGAILELLLDRYQPRLVMSFDNLDRAELIAAIPKLYALVSFQYEGGVPASLFNRGNIRV